MEEKVHPQKKIPATPMAKVTASALMLAVTVIVITLYTVSQKKNDTDVAGYIFNAHQPILIVFGR